MSVRIVIVLILGSLKLTCSLTSTPMSPTTAPEDVKTDLYLLEALPAWFVDNLLNNNTWDTVEALCPSVGKCKSEVEYYDEYMYPQFSGCCMSCKCGEECFSEGTCCYDKETRRREETEEHLIDQIGRNNIYGLVCVTPYLPATVEGIPSSKTIQSSYLLKQTCELPDGFVSSTDDLHRCYNPNENSIEDMTPVTSQTTAVNYRNIFCAACNNDTTTLKSWEQALNCYTVDDLPDELFLFSFSKQAVYTLIRNDGKCSITWMPDIDSNIDVRMCINVQRMYISCPAYAPEILKQLCAAKEALYLPYFGESGLYKNMFCLACNLMENTEVIQIPTINTLCPGFMESDDIQSGFILLLDLMSMTSQATVDPPVENICSRLGDTYIEELVDLFLYLKINIVSSLSTRMHLTFLT